MPRWSNALNSRMNRVTGLHNIGLNSIRCFHKYWYEYRSLRYISCAIDDTVDEARFSIGNTFMVHILVFKDGSLNRIIYQIPKRKIDDGCWEEKNIRLLPGLFLRQYPSRLYREKDKGSNTKAYEITYVDPVIDPNNIIISHCITVYVPEPSSDCLSYQ